MKSLEIIDKYIGTVYALSDDELKQIKKDLEVLELLKKKKVNIFLVEVCIAVIGYNFSVEYDDGQPTLTREEFDKLEQWLEE